MRCALFEPGWLGHSGWNYHPILSGLVLPSFGQHMTIGMASRSWSLPRSLRRRRGVADEDGVVLHCRWLKAPTATCCHVHVSHVRVSHEGATHTLAAPPPPAPWTRGTPPQRTHIQPRDQGPRSSRSRSPSVQCDSGLSPPLASMSAAAVVGKACPQISGLTFIKGGPVCAHRHEERRAASPRARVLGDLVWAMPPNNTGADAGL